MEGSPRLVQRPARSLPSWVTVNSGKLGQLWQHSDLLCTPQSVSMACDKRKETKRSEEERKEGWDSHSTH